MSSAPSSSTLELLLADPFENHPALEHGLPEDVAGKAPKPEKAPRGVDGGTLEAPDADPNDLSLQRWGIIIPDSPAGEQALAAIKPLRDLRQSQQDAKVIEFRVPAGMDLQKSLEWKNQVLRDEKQIPESERPKYLLILGDLHEVSAELGHVLANGSIVGRLHFDDPSGYAAYAEKVVSYEMNPSLHEKAAAHFFVSQDGTAATSLGDIHLIRPCVEMAQRKTRRPFPADVQAPWSDIMDPDDFLAKCNVDRPAVLLSVCHGAGRSSRSPWKSMEEQRALQGALQIDPKLGRDGLITAEDVKNKKILPGGLWFALACFGAGTPAKSAFYPWLSALEKAGQFNESAKRVLQSLPAEGEKPFLAALPKAALANPQGPLGMIGHLDLAWTYGFLDPNRMTQSRASRIFSSLQVMANGSRVGVAFDALMRAYREVNDELLSGYQAEEDARVWSRPYEVDSTGRAHAFMLRNDLRGYVLLGDPAARLPLARKAEETRGVRSLESTQQTPKAVVETTTTRRMSPDDMEKAVLAVLGQDGTTKDIAQKAGVSREELQTWIETYKAAGKAALGRI